MAPRRRVKVFVGSLRAKSHNRRLALALIRLLAPYMDCAIVDIGILPHYNEDDEEDCGVHVRLFREHCADADAFIFVTPEYNRSVPGVLKNAIDQGSRPQGASIWKGIPSGVIGASPGVLGSCMAQQHLRNILAAVDAPVMGQPEAYIQAKPGLFSEGGVVADENVTRFLAQWCESFRKWTELVVE